MKSSIESSRKHSSIKDVDVEDVVEQCIRIRNKCSSLNKVLESSINLVFGNSDLIHS